MISRRIVHLFATIVTVQGAGMEWCDYWNSRGVSRSECTLKHWSFPKSHDSSLATQLPYASSIPLCHVVTRVSQCAKTGFCASGLLCWVGGQPCCANSKLNRQVGAPGITNDGQCPQPEDLGLICRKKNPVSWCKLDRDCHMTSTMHKCCPTACGYSMCVPSRQPVDLLTRMSSLSLVPSQCPPLDEVPIWCRNPSNSGVSWCNTHNDCRQSSVHTRVCCPTRCGYNVCLLKARNGFIIA